MKNRQASLKKDLNLKIYHCISVQQCVLYEHRCLIMWCEGGRPCPTAAVVHCIALH